MKINIGILGSGNMAREHIKVFQNFNDFNISGVVGRGKNNINITKKKFPQLSFFNSLKDLFEHKKIDLLVICINEELVIKAYKEILKYKCVFLFEKPLGINFSETKRIFEYSKKNQKIFISLNRRFHSSTLLAVKLLKKKINKDPLTLFINDSQDIPRIKKLGLSNRLAKNLMYTNSIHLIDYINIFIKEKIKLVENVIKFKKKNPKYVLSYIKFGNGNKVIYKANWSERERWLINVSSKKISFSFQPLEELKINYPKNINLKKNYNYFDKKYKPGLYNQAIEILKLFNNKKNNLVKFKEYLKGVEIIKKIYEN